MSNPSLEQRVIELLTAGGHPLAVREIVRRLDLDSAARRELKTVLRRLIASGEVVKTRGVRIGLPSRMNLVVGRLSCSPAGHGFVIPDGSADRARNVYIAAANLKEAFHGDRVVARIERRSDKGPEGRIIRVLERSQSRIVGRYEDDGGTGGHLVPFDKRLLHDVFISRSDNPGARGGEMVLAEITRPPSAHRNPAGRILEVLGRLEDKGVDLKVILAKYGLDPVFSPEVEAEATRVPQAIREADVAGRSDFRDWLTVTVDPETARDHDDAISLSKLPDGGYRLAVHIADVAHYVRPGTALDREAYLRGTSVYFPEMVVPMLPHALSSRICSLVEGEARLTQSVVLDLDASGAVRKTEFHDGVIRSAARMTYEQVQAIVDGDAALRERYAPLMPLFLLMDELAKILRRRRYARGSLDFDVPEPKLVLGADGEMTGILASERLDSMRAIEEFMLAANEAVAEELHDAEVAALFRIHERPDPERVAEFCNLVASFGYRVPPNLETVRPEDFQRILRQIEGRPEQKLIAYLLLRTMKLARYHEENLGHFGLATENYAHFTSPIRRYPDLVVHRALRALRHGDQRSAPLDEAMTEMGSHLSERERSAAEAERELIEWKKVRFMAGRLGEVFSGYITGVEAFGLFVELDDIYVQGLAHVSSMSDDYYQFDEKAHALKGENTGKVYRLGDRVEVQVARVDLERRRIDFGIVGIEERRGQAVSPRPKRRPLRAERRRR